jgi:hypothetical protein
MSDSGLGPESDERGRPASLRDPKLAILSWALLPYLVFVVLLAISWNRWIEPYVDSGRELMTPLRIAQGERLYRDVRFYHGPLAPYLAAGLEAVQGRGLAARIALAGAIALMHLEALRRLSKRWLAPAQAALALSGAVALVFFVRPGGHLFPFSFDTAIAVTAIAWALFLAADRPSGRDDAVAGMCLLAALLTRPEMGAAAVAALLFEVGVSKRLKRLALVPAIVAAAIYALLSIGVPFATLRQEGWLALLGPPAAFRNVYASYAGVDRPAFRLLELALAAILLILVASFLAVASALSRRAAESRPRLSLAIEAAALLLVAAVALVSWRPPRTLAESLSLFPPLVRVVPILVVAAAVWRMASRLSRRGLKPACLSRVPDAVLWIAAFFASRLLLAAGYTGPYGSFLLPLPLVVGVAALFSLAERAAGSLGSAFPRLTAGALAVLILFRVAVLHDQYRQAAWSRVETPAGTLELLEPVAGATRQTLAALSAHLAPKGSLVGFPEGGFFTYVLGRSSPLPQEQFFPGHLDARGEEETILRMTQHPPDAVLVCNVLAVGHGSLAFGKDYLVRLGRFLDDRFVAVASFGPGAGPGAQIGDPQFFVTVRVPRQAPLP